MTNNTDFVFCKFHMSLVDIQLAYDALITVVPDVYPWCNGMEDALAATTLAELLSEFNFELSVTTDPKNIYGTGSHHITFTGEKNYPEFAKMFTVIAPFVKKGSWIMVTTELGGLMCYYFNGTNCEEIYGSVNFGEEYAPSFHIFNCGEVSWSGDAIADW